MNPLRFSNHRQAGFSLVELMIALVLGLLVTGAVMGVFLSNQQIQRQNEGLARMQESARYAFEVLSRSIREAGGIPCGSGLRVSNVLNPPSQWWADWANNTIRGYAGGDATFPRAFGTAAGDRVSGTEAIVVLSGTGSEGLIIVDHNAPAAEFKVNTTAHGIVDGDILLVCDYDHAAILQTTNASSSTVTIVHNTGTSGVSPGNCSKYLGWPVPSTCGSSGPGSDPPSYTFEKNGFISKLQATGWYIGHNGRGGRSLYRLRLQNNSGSALASAEEVAEGITDLQFQYLRRVAGGVADSYVAASSITDWSEVVAVRLTLITRTLESVGTDQQPIERQWPTVVTLRNRQP